MERARPLTATAAAAISMLIALGPAPARAQRAVEVPVAALMVGGAWAGAGAPLSAGLGTAPGLSPALSLAPAPSAVRVEQGPAARAAAPAQAARQPAAPLPASPIAAAARAVRNASPAEARGTLGRLAQGAAAMAPKAKDRGAVEAIRASLEHFDGGRLKEGDAAALDRLAEPAAGGSGAGSGGAGGGRRLELPRRLKVLAIDQVLFPGVRMHFTASSPQSGRTLAEAARGANGGYLLAVTPKADGSGYSEAASLVQVGEYHPDDDHGSALFHVIREAEVASFEQDGSGAVVANVGYPARHASDPAKARALMKAAQGLLRDLGRMDSGLATNTLAQALQADDPDVVATLMSSEMPFSTEAKQTLLAARSTEARLQGVLAAMTELKTEGELAERASAETAKMNREFVLRQKLKAIQKELGEGEGDELAELKARVEAAAMPPEVRAKAEKELEKLSNTNPQSAEYTVGRNYVDWLAGVPWSERTVDNLDLRRARDILDRDHAGLDAVKDRVIEFLAVRKRTGNDKGAILVFDGPPGVGKTSIAGAIAEAMGRRFVRFSAGGVKDEAEIRGHRRTYVGAMPGTIIQKMKEAGTVNPLMLIDEGDKIGSDPAKGDPAAALLEVLDPAQNGTFRDSSLTPAAIRRVIEGYTREAGVRNLKNEIDSILRKIAAWAETKDEPEPGTLDAAQVERYLGVPRYDQRETAANDVGLATGLSVSGYGGGTLNVEVAAVPGKGALTLRKQMGDMTYDSAHNVFTYIRSIAARFGVGKEYFEAHDFDIAFTPAGGIDGPSAGTAMAIAMLSRATGRKVRHGVAMTGEITLTGRVLPIGGLKEKTLAAHRAGYSTVLYPAGNQKDVEEIPAEVRQAIRMVPARSFDEVVAEALEEAGAQPAPAGSAAADMKAAPAAPAPADKPARRTWRQWLARLVRALTTRS